MAGEALHARQIRSEGAEQRRAAGLVYELPDPGIEMANERSQHLAPQMLHGIHRIAEQRTRFRCCGQ